MPQPASSCRTWPNADNTVWTLTLREGVTFGNGDPVDAAAVKASFDRHLDPEGGSALAGNAAQIAGVEVAGDLAVEFTLRDPWAGFPSLLAGAFGLVQNVAVIDAIGQEAFASNPVGGGAGPFEVSNFSAGQSITLEAKDDYWGGDVCLDKIVFTIIPQNRTAYDALRTGEVDVMLLAQDPELLAEYREDAGSFESFGAAQIGGDLLLINSGADGADTPGADVRVRQAIAAAIDPQLINDRAFSGSALMSTGLIPAGSEFFTPTTGPAYDPDAAAALVAEVKADTGWDGTIRLASANTSAKSEAAIAVKAMLDAVGFNVDLSSQHTGTEMSTLVRVDRDFDLAMWGLSAHEENLWTTLKQYYSDAPNNAGN
ncbi:MAG TPA: ABC transporter substrate-binding protein, partial [Ilumatobacteraceae bacterium]|nr:ABC transporter substrate-binding protein [Ilumatobacteraceae bacterium]